MKYIKIGFVGQGYVGKNYADNYESRGYDVVRYSLDDEHKHNKDKITQSDIVFIAVPTPTTPKGPNISIVEGILSLVKDGAIAVVKSTLPLRTTEYLAKKHDRLFVFYCPEFLSEKTARQDVDVPHANIIGLGMDNAEYREKAEIVLGTLPEAPFSKVCSALEAELIKYSRNVHGLHEVIFYNMFYDLARSIGADYEVLREYFKNDPLHVHRYASPVHDSGHAIGKLGRGAGGHCFLKDFRAFSQFSQEALQDEGYTALLKALEQKNLHLLVTSKKDLDLVEEVYGEVPTLFDTPKDTKDSR